MALIPSFFGGRMSNIFDPFSLDISIHLRDSLSNVASSAGETSQFANARIDWKETQNRTSSSWIFQDKKGGGEGGGRRRKYTSNQWREEQRTRGEERQMASFAGLGCLRIRRFRLPENAKMDEIKVAMENGVLTVTVQKRPRRSLR